MTSFPTPYPEVNTLLRALIEGVQDVLGSSCVAVILHGSLASGDFNPLTSDIDFLVVTTQCLPAHRLPELVAMHTRLRTSGLPYADLLEGSYIPRQALRRYDSSNNAHPALRSDGSFDVDGHGSDWIIQRHLIRQFGIPLFGPPPARLIDPVTPSDLRGAVRGILREWWTPPLPSPERFESSHYRAYAVLTMCRALYTLEYADVVSKPVAARWALTTLGRSWAGLIEAALTWQPGADFDAHHQFVDFILFTLERAAA